VNAEKNEITLELIARTVFELKRLPKYEDKDEFELISTAYGFLDFCKTELANGPKRKEALLRQSGPEMGWSDLLKELTGNTRKGERLLKFFQENDHYRRLLRFETSRNKVSATEVSIETLKHAKFPIGAAGETKQAFESWDQEDKSRIRAKSGASEKN
jgi:hypothetical protein